MPEEASASESASEIITGLLLNHYPDNSKAGIILATPPLLEEGERSDARRKEGWRGQDRRLCCAS